MNTVDQDGAGEAPDFETLVRDLRPQLHRYCARMTGSVIDGEDVLQMALIKALEASRRSARIDNPVPWVFRIAHNTAVDYLRGRRREVAMRERQRQLADGAEAVFWHGSTRENLEPFLRLPARQRSAVIFADVFGYTSKEVAEMTGTSLASVKAALHRGRSTLRREQPPANQPRPPLSARERALLAQYANYFNNHEFNKLREMLVDEVRLELVDRVSMENREEVEQYFGNYARQSDWYMQPGQVEGRAAIVVRDPDHKTGAPLYFILLNIDAEGVRLIRDFRYARYVMKDVRFISSTG